MASACVAGQICTKRRGKGNNMINRVDLSALAITMILRNSRLVSGRTQKCGQRHRYTSRRRMQHKGVQHASTDASTLKYLTSTHSHSKCSRLQVCLHCRLLPRAQHASPSQQQSLRPTPPAPPPVSASPGRRTDLLDFNLSNEVAFHQYIISHLAQAVKRRIVLVSD